MVRGTPLGKLLLKFENDRTAPLVSWEQVGDVRFFMMTSPESLVKQKGNLSQHGI